jgi:hypothetical protein
MKRIKIITSIVEDYFRFLGVKRGDCQKVTRKREIVQARQIAMVMCEKYTDYSQVVIGHYIGGKDHATVNHAKKTVANLCETDKSYRLWFDAIDRRIKTYFEMVEKYNKTEMNIKSKYKLDYMLRDINKCSSIVNMRIAINTMRNFISKSKIAVL